MTFRNLLRASTRLESFTRLVSTVEFRLTRRAALAAFVLGFCAVSSARADEAAPETPAATSSEVAAVISALPPAPPPKLRAAAPRAAVEAVRSKSATPALAKTATPAVTAVPVATPATAVTGATETMRQAATRLKLPLPLPDARVVVWKGRRELQVWSGQTLVKTYRVALGTAPVGHKVQQGDGRTPEGEFFICTRNADTSSFHIFLGLSYPALPDAKRGLEARAITEREFQAIRARLASRSAPLWRTRLGGWVGIHGGTGERFANKQSAARKSPDWTAGCIALTNRQIEEVYAATRLGTPVSVRR